MANEKYTIGVVGGGAVGLLYAALLSEVASVTVKTRSDDQARDIVSQGIQFDRRSGESQTFLSVKASSDYRDLKECDAVIVGVKSYDTEIVARELDRVLRADALVLTLQNGLQAFDVLRNELRNPERVFAGVTYVGASRIDGRRVVNGDNFRTVVDVEAGELATRMKKSKFDIEVSKDVKQAVWDKMVLNVGQNALSAVTNLNFGQMLESHDCLDAAEKLVLELKQVGEAEGLIFPYSLMDKLRDNWEGSPFYPSMWQDLHNGRRTEVDAINGAISRLGKKHSISTPYNDMMTSLIHALESSISSGKI